MAASRRIVLLGGSRIVDTLHLLAALILALTGAGIIRIVWLLDQGSPTIGAQDDEADAPPARRAA